MTATKMFSLDNDSKVFNIDIDIKSVDYVAVYISDTGLTSSYNLVPKNSYTVINNSIVFSSSPIGSYLRVVVTTSRNEALDYPSNIANISANMDVIKYTADNMDVIVSSYAVIATADNLNIINNVGVAIPNIIKVSENITDVNTIVTNIIDINTIASNVDNVNNVGEAITNVNILANNLYNVNSVGEAISNINNVSNNIPNVNLIVNHLNNVNIVAMDLNEPVSEINTVAVNIANVNKVGDNIDNVNIVANNISSIVNKAKFRVRSETSLVLDAKTNSKYITMLPLPDMVGFELHTTSNSMKNVSGRDLDIIGTMAVQITTTSTTDIHVYVYSETSVDGVNWTVNSNSLRKIKVVKEGTDYLTVPSLLVNSKWVNGTYNRFRFYKEGAGDVTITAVSDTVNGNTITGNSFLWTIHEI